MFWTWLSPLLAYVSCYYLKCVSCASSHAWVPITSHVRVSQGPSPLPEITRHPKKKKRLQYGILCLSDQQCEAGSVVKSGSAKWERCCPTPFMNLQAQRMMHWPNWWTVYLWLMFVFLIGVLSLSRTHTNNNKRKKRQCSFNRESMLGCT